MSEWMADEHRPVKPAHEANPLVEDAIRLVQSGSPYWCAACREINPKLVALRAAVQALDTAPGLVGLEQAVLQAARDLVRQG